MRKMLPKPEAYKRAKPFHWDDKRIYPDTESCNDPWNGSIFIPAFPIESQQKRWSKYGNRLKGFKTNINKTVKFADIYGKGISEKDESYNYYSSRIQYHHIKAFHFLHPCSSPDHMQACFVRSGAHGKLSLMQFQVNLKGVKAHILLILETKYALTPFTNGTVVSPAYVR